MLPELWELAIHALSSDRQWMGWILSFVSDKCYGTKTCVPTKNNPFVAQRLDQVLERLGEHVDFCVANMVALFVQIPRVCVISENRYEMQNYEVSDGDKIIMVVRMRSSGEVGIQEQLYTGVDGKDEWQLRFVGATTDGTDRDPQKWKGELFARHGGPDLVGWWKQKRVWKTCCEVGGNFIESVNANWDILVYCQKYDSDMDKLRDGYLEHIGGQVKVYCCVHRTPMIPAVQLRGLSKQCSIVNENELRCTMKAYMCCAFDQCTAAVCIHHSRPDEEEGSCLYINAIEDENVADEEGIVSRIESEELTLRDGNHGSAGVIEDEVGGNFVNLNEEMFVTDNYVDDDEFMLGPQDGLGGSNGGSENGFHFETTNAGRSSYDILAGKGNVPGHVILNNCGSCLIRRNCQLKGTRYQQAFLQQIVSSSRGHAVPLVYPEGMLFPSIFWTDTENNSMVGALPAAVMASKNECRAFGFASMQDHIKARLTNLSLRCATDSRYVFYAYDCIANINLRGEDTRVILSRGFVESQGNGGLKANRSREFNTDAIDSRPVVHRLAAAVRENNFTYFYTQTVNQSGFFGIKPVKDWIDSKEYESLLFEGRGAMTYEEKNEIRKAGKESSCIPLLRQWMEVSEVFMTYIARSEEYPLGKVENIWWRHEYQTAKANLSHIHALIRLEASENQDDILDRIRGMVGDIIRPEEAIGFIEKGVLENVDEYLETREMARKVLPHFCSQRCLERIGPGENDLRCRAVYSRRDSSDATRHTMETIRVHHTPMAISIMAELGLCEECDDTGHFFPYDARLVSQRHHPPTSGGEGNISPTSPWLFAATKSQSNLQFCTSYSTARYVTKYAAGTDENNRVYIGVMTNTGDNGFSIRMDSQHLHNTKVTGSAINEKKVHEKRRDKHYPTGRGLAVTEAAAQLLGYPQVYTDLEFVDIATVPMEDRAGFDRDKPINKFKSTGRPPSGPNDVSTTDVIAAFKVRNETLRLPEWRKITRTQELMLKDLLFCPISVDKITVFGVRPPELAFVGHVGNYFRWFQREKAVPHGKAEDLHEEMIDYDVMKTAWVDGLNCRLRVRVRAIPEILKYIDEPGRRGRTQRGVCRLFLKLQECTIPENEQGLRHHSTEGLEIQTLRNMFFELGDTSKLPVPVFSNIKPTTPHRFLIHVLLSMGEFQNELELWEEGTIQRAFLKARLISNNDQEASVRALVKKYVMEQLLFMPGGTQMFDRLCIAAHSVLMSTLINDELPIDEMPSVLYTSLRQETEEKVERDIANKRLLLAKVSIAAVRPVTAIRNVPEAEELAVCSKQNPLSREIIFTRSERQGEESFQEQFACYNKCKLAIDTYATATPTFTKCRAITGGPGCGKTFVLNVLVLYAMSRGLSVTVTCLLAKRADFLGGIHVHSLFCIPVHESASVQRLAELAVISLYKNPEKLAFLQRLDVLAFDELGQISSELKSCIDMIMRRIRKSDQYMGGVLVLATIDPIQLRPIKGRPFLLSPFVLTCYRFSVLKHSVRAADDPLLQRIQNITRMLAHEYTPGIINELSELLERHCTFVESWSDASITPTMLRCFGKKAAIRQEGLRFMNEIGSSGRTVLYREADDFELSNLSHSQWQPATAPVIRALTKDVREPKVLPFYELAVYEMTYNKPGHFTHSQIAVLAEMPTNEMLRSFENVQVMLAPVGCKSVPPGVTCANELLTHGWRQVCVGLAPERVQSTKMGKKGKRQQYGLRHRVSSTIHAVMGSDLSHVVTKVSLTDPMYRLWEKEQVVVLLSRTVSAKDIIFVGRPRETIDAILQVIQIRSQYSEYMNHIINVLSDEGTSPRNLRDVPVLDQNQHPFCPLDVSQPNDCSGYCYILVSLKDSKSTYIGQTKKLVVRLKEHNSGYGSQGTSDPRLRPWALLAYVTGFDGNVSSMLAFERQWKVRRDNYQISAPMQIADMGRSLIASWQETNPDAVDLRYIATGTIGIITRLQEAGDVSL
jgi:predicted GIY-YIG superfamily endonuclease